MKRQAEQVAYRDDKWSDPATDKSAPVHPLVRADALRNFKTLVSELGGDPLALLRACLIDPEWLEDRKAKLPFTAMMELLERAAVELRCPEFGMRLAANQDGTRVLGPLDVAMRNAPTLGHAFRYCAEHVHAYSDATEIYLEKRPDQRVFMQFEILVHSASPRRQVTEHALALVQHATRAISGGHSRVREVWFTHDAGAPMPAYRASFKVPLKFGQCVNGIFFDERDLERPIPDADPELYEIATSFIDLRFPPTAMNITTRVRIIVSRLLIEGSCTHDQVAAALGLQPRTLQRRLREEGVSFQSIKDSVRRHVAMLYLQQPNVSLARLTEILGYSETSVLSRSCHRWFAASPRHLRHSPSENDES